MGDARRRRIRMKNQQQSRGSKWRTIFRRHRRKHDPMLVLNMASFNFADGWDRIFNPLKTHERGT
jgi:hypothetical protein